MARTEQRADEESPSFLRRVQSFVAGTHSVEAPAPKAPEWPLTTGVGICCSGGGIRSASYCLGALEQLQEDGVLEQADYLTSVSGGGYMAGAMTMMAAQDDGLVWDDGFPRPFAPNAPETRYLRDHSSYLAYGAWGKLRLILRLLLGMLANLVFVGAFIVIFGRLAGHVALLVRPSLIVGEEAGKGTPEIVTSFLYIAACFAVAGLVLLMITTLRRVQARTEDRLFRSGVFMIFGVAAALVFVFAALPWLIEQFRHYLVPNVDILEKPAEILGVDGTKDDPDGSSMIARLYGVLAALGIPTMVWGAISAIVKSRKSKIALFAARFVAPLLLGFAFIAVANDAVSTGWGERDYWWFGGAALALLILRFSDPTTSSMHPFYKRRLSSAFALERIWRNPDGTVPPPEGPRGSEGTLDARERDYEQLVCLSKTKPTHRWPTWVCCASANISDEGKTPPGRNALTFTFDSEWIGGPEVGWVRTSDFEDALGPKRAEDITLPAAVAISGAALSPSMGKMTKPSLTMLLTLVNARLGVWLPNPRVVNARLNDPGRRGWARTPFFRILREMLGNNEVDSKFLYITDGGHWENLGLVELLRRGCTEIYCFDAAGDKGDTFFTIGEAIALARGELGVEITLRPDEIRQPNPDDPMYVSRDHVLGTFTYPPDENGKVVEGVIAFVKAEVTADAPWDVRAYKEKDPNFPNNSLIEQMFADETFESYRALGAFSAHNAVVSVKQLGDG